MALKNKKPNDQVAHLVLSGGLGNSPYVQRELSRRYAFGASSFDNTTQLRVTVAQDPQLAVCKGNVADRLQRLISGTSILNWRCSRLSYGTSCRVQFDPRNPDHVRRPREKDELDGKLYINNAVQW